MNGTERHDNLLQKENKKIRGVKKEVFINYLIVFFGFL